MDPIVFIIIAVIAYSFFKPKNKPERTTSPTTSPQQQDPRQQYPRQQYPQQYPQPEPPRKRGILSDLEDILRDAQVRTEEASRPPVPNQPIERPTSSVRPTSSMRPTSEARSPSQMKASSEKRSSLDPRIHTPKKPAAKRASTGNDYGSQEPQSMHKNATDRKRLTLGRASIVQGFIWSQVLGEPVSKRSPTRSRRRVT